MPNTCQVVVKNWSSSRIKVVKSLRLINDMIGLVRRTSIFTGLLATLGGVQGRHRHLSAVFTVFTTVSSDMPSSVIRGFVGLFLLVSVVRPSLCAIRNGPDCFVKVQFHGPHEAVRGGRRDGHGGCCRWGFRGDGGELVLWRLGSNSSGKVLA